ncbi:hypothetical protein [Pigmentiphaga sp.]|uniref:hypothetical protein n=1 Tax=Pigmentiphaga sp. TaxID=1977564 RepID=UPI00128D3EE8|nr:hypothetical protein [Pigmentiphaga sp.]MPS30191.1 hypothetical protein [Alcaligenaceae bacterium SAGV5]MPS55483.1 hypothetical protein [Alcaligenaceae bacterium SAGV3]MPT55434.1 hypothetical protein [Alcaligenaceae bacterium]
MKISEKATAESGIVGTMREGVLAQKFLLTGKNGSPNNYLLNVGRTGAGGWTAPRHRHNFDQIRYVLRGNYPYAKGRSMPEGWVGYFPESVHYGPQDRPEGLEMVVCQFGGASGHGFLSVEEREAANIELAKIGEFKNGIFTYYDESGKRHNQDGSEACFEKAMGRKPTYSRPRYDDLIMMNPSNYEWISTEDTGVFRKDLGSFTERNTGVGFIRLEADATYHDRSRDSIELLFISQGRVEVGGQEYGPHSAFELTPEDGCVRFAAREETEVFRIKLPKF